MHARNVHISYSVMCIHITPYHPHSYTCHISRHIQSYHTTHIVVLYHIPSKPHYIPYHTHTPHHNMLTQCYTMLMHYNISPHTCVSWHAHSHRITYTELNHIHRAYHIPIYILEQHMLYISDHTMPMYMSYPCNLQAWVILYQIQTENKNPCLCWRTAGR